MAAMGESYWGRDAHVIPRLRQLVMKLGRFLLDSIEERLRMLELDGTPVHIRDLPEEAIDDLLACGEMFVFELLDRRAQLLIDSGVALPSPPRLGKNRGLRLIATTADSPAEVTHTTPHQSMRESDE